MKTRILGMAMAIIALFGSTALAAISVCGSGCWPLCK
jgi:hypothetical protein